MEHELDRLVHTRWGMYENIAFYVRGEKQCKTKRLYITPLENISYQRHTKRGENWVIIQGSGTFVQDGKFYEVSQGDAMHIPVGSMHAVKAGEKGIEILEVQFGDECIEDDITRFYYKWNDIVRFVGVDE